MGTEFPTPIYVAIAICGFLLLLGAWTIVTMLGMVKPIFLPSPLAVIIKLVKLAQDGTLGNDVAISVYRISIGFLIASVMALATAILIGSYRFWEAAIEPILDFVRYMPVVAFVPLSILWSGTSDLQKFLIIWIGTYFQQALMFKDNIKRVPADFVGFGRTLGMSDLRVLMRIVVPSAMPQIWDTLRISLGWAWTWVTLAELVAANSGLGYRITVAQRYLQTDMAIGYILVLGVLGLATDQIMRFLGRQFFKYEKRT
ncbi:ABC transporter permease [Mesorhizobium sp. BR1-1-9]|uniref:ABC transporter permease n=1 Tax=Mesorhizobium sp. BR1-1-9 TaxID=2876646 RepID=UPI001CD166D5|nr:ABC transporter permease [Mesorhizobium sp. BR1-1-9]MBZ9870496.1 ABC transporter permease [Mesorhizobium sp. BR1-1-9]